MGCSRAIGQSAKDAFCILHSVDAWPDKVIDNSGDCKDSDSCNVVGYGRLSDPLLHEGKKVCFGGEEISAQKKKSGT